MKKVNEENRLQTSFYSELEMQSETKETKFSYRFPILFYLSFCSHYRFNRYQEKEFVSVRKKKKEKGNEKK